MAQNHIKSIVNWWPSTHCNKMGAHIENIWWILFETELPKAETVPTTMNCRKRFPKSTIKRKISEQFGSSKILMLNRRTWPTQRQKFDFKWKRIIFIGYFENTKSYRLKQWSKQNYEKSRSSFNKWRSLQEQKSYKKYISDSLERKPQRKNKWRNFETNEGRETDDNTGNNKKSFL